MKNSNYRICGDGMNHLIILSEDNKPAQREKQEFGMIGKKS